MRLLVVAWILAACGGQLVGVDGGASKDGTTTQADSAVCVDIEPSAFSTSCNADHDCIGAWAGNLCSGYDCICPVSSISAMSQAAYDEALSKVPKGPGPMCGCPLFGTPRCIASQCVFCPNAALHPPSYPPGCPDGG